LQYCRGSGHFGERRNAELVRMMRDLVSERRAAGRLLPDAVHRFIEN
jgi:hypothetical protein